MTQLKPVAVSDPFVGAWQLDPTQCEYEIGAPPSQVVYRIEADGDALSISIEWVGADGQPGHLAYRSIPDGRERPSPLDPAIADTVVTERPDVWTLETTAWRSGIITGRARHTVSTDGQRMSVVQSGTTDDGITYRNVSVYIRRKA
jgi:hypothetical protein